MKKFLIALIIGIFVLSGLGASAVQSNNLKPVSEKTVYQEPPVNLLPRDYTHTVLVEVGTATTCSACPASNAAWHTIYESGNYDFEYTEMVYNMNAAANARFSEFNPRWVPTSYWDGGEYVYPGTNTGVFYSYLGLSGARVVPDLVASLQVSWLGSAKIQITYSVENNDANSYPGRIRIYVIELESTLYIDYSGNPYYHALLDFAVNKAISIPAGDTISDSVTWDGASEGFPGIKQDNIQVILAVFGNTPHQSYSDPPSGNPFTAYYSDECIAATPGTQNNPPGKPTIGGPKEGKANTPIEFSFKSIDPDGDNIAEYIINWGDGSGDETVSGPYSSGAAVTASHTWTTNGDYVVSAKAKDVNGATGPSGIKSLSIPRPRSSFSPFYKFLESHPHICMILKLVFNQF